MIRSKRLPGVTLLSLFFIFGAVMSALTALMLLFPHTILEALWRLNPRVREGLAGLGLWAVLLMVFVCGACTTASIGLWRMARWGWWTAFWILAINMIGDSTNGVVNFDWRTLIGIPVGGAMLAYLILRRQAFTPNRSPPLKGKFLRKNAEFPLVLCRLPGLSFPYFVPQDAPHAYRKISHTHTLHC